MPKAEDFFIPFQHRIHTASRVMNANGVPRKLARKVRWSLATATAAYGVGVVWKN
jgi:hypothetical protein